MKWMGSILKIITCAIVITLAAIVMLHAKDTPGKKPDNDNSSSCADIQTRHFFMEYL